VSNEPSPAFLFYVKDWRSSRRVQNMNFAARGMYFEMLVEQWETGAVPATAAACADLLGGTTAEWTRSWENCARASLNGNAMGYSSIRN
jgi:hypothetical protein